MSYQALYRKYRPQDFSSLVGQEHIQKILQHAVAQGRTVHAYLFCGPRGTGKTSTAKILAKAVNCLNPQNGEPCGVCPACQRIAAGTSLDILEIDAASNRGIDEVRDLRERVKYAPAQEKLKVYIIDEVHMLTNEAFNALLKTLEEPPAHIIFILATTEAHKVPLTVLSRCQRLDFHRIPDAAMESRLQEIAQKEQIAITADAVSLIAKQAQGGLRDAIGLLDQAAGSSEGQVTLKLVQDLIGAVDSETVSQMAAYLAQKEIAALLTGVQDMLAQGRDLRQFLQELLTYLRELLLYELSGNQGPKPPGLDRFTVLPKSDEILRMWEALAPADREMKQSLSPRIILELALLRATQAQTAPSTQTAFAGQAAAQQMPAAKTASASTGTASGFTPRVTEEKNKTAAAPSKSGSGAGGGEAPIGPQNNGSKNPGFAAKAAGREPATAAGKMAATAPAAKSWQEAAAPVMTEAQTETASTAAAKPRTCSLGQVQSIWPQVLQQVKSSAVTTHAFLREGKPVRLTGNRLTLCYPERLALHMEQICQSDTHKKRVQEILQTLLGVRLELEGILGDAAMMTAPAPEADLPLPEPPPEEASFGEEFSTVAPDASLAPSENKIGQSAANTEAELFSQPHQAVDTNAKSALFTAAEDFFGLTPQILPEEETAAPPKTDAERPKKTAKKEVLDDTEDLPW